MKGTSLNILLIEDDRAIAKVIKMELEHQGHIVQVASDGSQGLNLALTGENDIILLDVMLPFLNGYEICKQVRAVKETPVLLLTAKDDIRDRVFGLDLGADDYLTKPFAMEELLARIRAILRRGKSSFNAQGRLKFHDLEIDSEAYQVILNNSEIHLTKKEFELLYFLMEHPNHVLSREQILEHIWGYDNAGDTNVIDVYVRFLRNKIEGANNIRYIHTVRGVGYVLRREDSQGN